jgi:ribonuclease M5
MVKVKEVIVVEGRYDKNTLSQIVDATIITLGGFAVFKDKEKLLFLRRLAEKQGMIVLTDSDGAGFVIRNYLKGALPKELVKQAYIPDAYGKERRKRTPGKEGKLGVEGMKPEVLLDSLKRAGATFLTSDDQSEDVHPHTRITKADLFEMGLSGGISSGERRKALLKRLNLPEHLTANGLLDALNLLYSYEELVAMVQEI